MGLSHFTDNLWVIPSPKSNLGLDYPNIMLAKKKKAPNSDYPKKKSYSRLCHSHSTHPPKNETHGLGTEHTKWA